MTWHNFQEGIYCFKKSTKIFILILHNLIGHTQKSFCVAQNNNKFKKFYYVSPETRNLVRKYQHIYNRSCGNKCNRLIKCIHNWWLLNEKMRNFFAPISDEEKLTLNIINFWTFLIFIVIIYLIFLCMHTLATFGRCAK